MRRALNRLYTTYYKYNLRRKKVYIAKEGHISTESIFGGNNYIAGTVLDCSVGYGTYIMDHCWFQNCQIGKYCSIASEVKMVARRGHPTQKFVATSPVFYLKNALIDTYVDTDLYKPYEECPGDSQKLVIGNDVWIGSRVTLIGAISIGNGAIIGAGAVVNRDIPPYAVVVGVPGKIIRYRFEEEERVKLEQIAWWDKGEEWIKNHVELFGDITNFLACTMDSR